METIEKDIKINEDLLKNQFSEESSKVINKSLEIKGIKKYNKKGELIYNIDNIREECDKREGIILIQFIMQILNEEKDELLIRIYEELGKDFLLNKLYEALQIENNGGAIKKSLPKKKIENGEEIFVIEDNDNERKTPGGVLFTLFKNDQESRLIYKEITRKENKSRAQRKKAYRLFQKLAL
jgi:hypothetical protein